MAKGAKGPVAGRMWDMPQWQGVVTVSPDGQSLTGSFNGAQQTSRRAGGC